MNPAYLEPIIHSSIIVIALLVGGGYLTRRQRKIEEKLDFVLHFISADQAKSKGKVNVCPPIRKS